MTITNIDIKDIGLSNKTYYANFTDKHGVDKSVMYQTNGWYYPHISKDEFIEMIKEDNGITK